MDGLIFLRLFYFVGILSNIFIAMFVIRIGKKYLKGLRETVEAFDMEARSMLGEYRKLLDTFKERHNL